jgi:DNA mismatch repair protein MutS
LPAEIIDRSTEILKVLEKGDEPPAMGAPAEVRNNLNDDRSQEIIKELRNLDILSMTPLEALNMLYLMQKKIDDRVCSKRTGC